MGPAIDPASPFFPALKKTALNIAARIHDPKEFENNF